MNHNIGLYLQGGGAKGAFQVGVLKALSEKGIHFDVIAGTSIGAINGMVIFYNGLARMQELWLEMLKGEYGTDRTLPVLETKEAIAAIVDYLGTDRDSAVKHFYVNYAPVNNGQIQHAFTDLVGKSDEEVKNYVRASSLLPNFYRWQEREAAGEKEQDIFMEQIQARVYDGYRLDGGLLNNHFMEPFLLTEVDRIYAAVFEQDFPVPEAIWQKYEQTQVVLIKPDFIFRENDTMMFNRESFFKWFEAGYLQGQKITL